MSDYDTLPKRKPALEEVTEFAARGKSIKWYRSKLPKELHRELHQRSDLLGGAQTLGFLAYIVATGTLTLYSAANWPWYATLFVLHIHGIGTAFMINAVHELGHGTVFKTKRLNQIFVHIFAFIGWINHEKFGESHARHHRYTLHPPDDLEVVLPIRLIIKHVFKSGFVDWKGLRWKLNENWRTARGKFKGEWETTLYPEGDEARRWKAIRWSRIVLVGHLVIALVSIVCGILVSPVWFMVPVAVSLNGSHSNWLFFFCNNTQHVGLQDNVADFRKCCRTFTVNPFVQFLYWHMNYHIEHHMYAAVPCYKLGQLHRAIRHELPPTPNGLIPMWKEIADILNKQEKDPTYQHEVQLPEPSEAPAIAKA